MKCPKCGEDLAIEVRRLITVNDYCSQETELEWDGKTWNVGYSSILDCDAGDVIEEEFDILTDCCGHSLGSAEIEQLGLDAIQLDALPWG